VLREPSSTLTCEHHPRPQRSGRRLRQGLCHSSTSSDPSRLLLGSWATMGGRPAGVGGGGVCVVRCGGGGGGPLPSDPRLCSLPNPAPAGVNKRTGKHRRTWNQPHPHPPTHPPTPTAHARACAPPIWNRPPHLHDRAATLVSPAPGLAQRQGEGPEPLASDAGRGGGAQDAMAKLVSSCLPAWQGDGAGKSVRRDAGTSCLRIGCPSQLDPVAVSRQPPPVLPEGT
jgi:hypothetical protein